MSTVTAAPTALERQFHHYRQMLLIRRFEEMMIRLAGEAPGLNHASIGQEAVAVGVASALEPQDLVFTAHRPNGHILARGADPGVLMAELFGKADGCCKGKGGNMHLLDVAHGVMGANGIVGGNLPLAVGAALTSRLRQQGRVVACFFGEGTSNGGPFHESLNMAAVWKLPVVFVCENNQYAVTVPMALSTSVERIAERGPSYRMPAVVVDGNDCDAVEEAVRAARVRAAGGEGPSLVECLTYRLRGHYEGEQQDVYRAPAEIEQAWTQEPIGRLAQRLLASGCDPAVLDDMERSVAATIQRAVELARSSPYPAREALFEDVFGPEVPA